MQASYHLLKFCTSAPFSAELKRRNIKLPFETISRADRMMDERVLETLAEMGCYRIWIGSESGSQQTHAGWTWRLFFYPKKNYLKGIGYDGRTLFPMMPYYNFRHLSDEDLASIVVYIRSLKPVRKMVPKTQLPPPIAAGLKPLTLASKEGISLVNGTQAMLAAGALDVFFTPIQMKKNRPGVVLTVLCEPKRTDEMIELLLQHTTTFGVRVTQAQRQVLDRETRRVVVMASTPPPSAATEFASARPKSLCR